MDSTIVTSVGLNKITNAIATSTKIYPKYFKVSTDPSLIVDPSLTDIPSAVLTKNISAWFKSSNNEFRLYYHILNTEVSAPVTVIGAFDRDDTLLFVTKLDPPVDIQTDIYIEARLRLANFESVFDFTEIPWDEYEQTLTILGLENNLITAQNDIRDIFIALHDHENRIRALEALDINQLLNDHNLSLYAHPPIQAALRKAGIFVRPAEHEYVGQFWDEKVTFDPSVNNYMLVYKDIDGLYKPAIDNGDKESKVAGIARTDLNRVITNGYVKLPNTITTGWNVGDDIFLSDITPGAFTNLQTDVKVGIYLGNDTIILGSVGSGTGQGEVLFEDLTYMFMLYNLPYEDVYYDIFTKRNTITYTGDVQYVSKDNAYQINSPGAVFETGDIVNSPGTLYRFLFHIETDTTYSISYSTDGGSTWNTLTDTDKTILVNTGFNTLRFKITFTSTGKFYSYGVFYNYNFEAYTSDTRLFHKYLVDTDVTAPIDFVLPDGIAYTPDGKSLQVYLNRLRLFIGTDYEEIDERTIRFLIDLKAGDELLFIEEWGYVDTSIDNHNKLLSFHFYNSSILDALFKDKATGSYYKLYVENGEILLEPTTISDYNLVNKPPVLDSYSWSSSPLFSNSTYTLTVNASDPENDPITINVTTAHSNVTITKTGINTFDVTLGNFTNDETVIFTIELSDGTNTIYEDISETVLALDSKINKTTIDSSTSSEIYDLETDSQSNIISVGGFLPDDNGSLILLNPQLETYNVKTINITGKLTSIIETSSNRFLIGGYHNNGSIYEGVIFTFDNNTKTIVNQKKYTASTHIRINKILPLISEYVFIGNEHVIKLDSNLNVLTNKRFELENLNDMIFVNSNLYLTGGNTVNANVYKIDLNLNLVSAKTIFGSNGAFRSIIYDGTNLHANFFSGSTVTIVTFSETLTLQNQKSINFATNVTNSFLNFDGSNIKLISVTGSGISIITLDTNLNILSQVEIDTSYTEVLLNNKLISTSLYLVGSVNSSASIIRIIEPLITGTISCGTDTINIRSTTYLDSTPTYTLDPSTPTTSVPTINVSTSTFNIYNKTYTQTVCSL